MATGGRDAATGQDLADRLVREEARGQAHRGGGDHEAPAGRGVDVGERLEHLELGDRIRLGAAERLRDLQREEPRVGERPHRRRRQGPQPLPFLGAGRDGFANGLH
jgi:hypothetical protein